MIVHTVLGVKEKEKYSEIVNYLNKYKEITNLNQQIIRIKQYKNIKIEPNLFGDNFIISAIQTVNFKKEINKDIFAERILKYNISWYININNKKNIIKNINMINQENKYFINNINILNKFKHCIYKKEYINKKFVKSYYDKCQTTTLSPFLIDFLWYTTNNSTVIALSYNNNIFIINGIESMPLFIIEKAINWEYKNVIIYKNADKKIYKYYKSFKKGLLFIKQKDKIVIQWWFNKIYESLIDKNSKIYLWENIKWPLIVIKNNNNCKLLWDIKDKQLQILDNFVCKNIMIKKNKIIISDNNNTQIIKEW